VAEGWKCLEVGAGAGSISEWLADLVGETGRVVAADVYTKFLQPIERPNLEVMELDVLADELPAAEFDLVYARLVVEHLGVRALKRMAAAVSPGGLLVLEDYDFAGATSHPPDELGDRVRDAIVGFMEGAGFDPFMGRRLVSELRAAGFDDVDAEGRSRVIVGDTPETAFYRLTLETLREPLLESEALTAAEIDEALARLDDPERVSITPTMIAAWGRM
jgi:SAM-dependent methyltransferase